MNKIAQISIAVLAMTLLAVGQQTAKYAVAQRLPLTQQYDGMDGELQVLTDSRINTDVRKQLWNQGPWNLALLEDTPSYRSFQELGPANARLEIADAHGIVVWDKLLPYPLVEVKSRIIGSQQVFFVTVDDSAAYSSYSGLTTTLFTIDGKLLKPVEAFDVVQKRRAPVVVAKTEKSAWKDASRGGSVDLLAFYCALNPSALPGGGRGYGILEKSKDYFFVHYVRYHFDGEEWNKYERIEPGYWESDQPFPLESSFPQ